MVVVLVFILFVVSVGPVEVDIPLTQSNDSVTIVRDSAKALSYTSHEAIIIRSDSDYSVWPGSGSQSDPYVIEDYSFDTTNHCIFIEGVSVYFVIRGCYFTSSDEYPDWYETIEVQSSRYIRIENCTFERRQIGIFASETEEIQIVNCSFLNVGSGIRLYDGGNAIISECYLDLNSSAIRISDFETVSVTGNEIHSPRSYMIDCNRCKYITIAGNFISIEPEDYYYSRCIDIYYGEDFVIRNNTILGGEYGIIINDFSSGLIVDNILESSIGTSLTITRSTDLEVRDNILPRGIRIDGRKEKHWDHTFVNNDIHGKDFGYFVNRTNLNIDTDIYAQVVIVSSSDIIIENMSFTETSIPITVVYCENFTVKNSHFMNNSYYGIEVFFSKGISITNNRFGNCTYGDISLSHSTGVTIENCQFEDRRAITGYRLRNSKIINNSFIDGGFENYYTSRSIDISEFEDGIIANNSFECGGIDIYSLYHSTIENNTIRSSSGDNRGIRLSDVSFSSISHNVIGGSAYYGITISDSTQILVEDNEVELSGSGVYLYRCRRSSITENRIRYCDSIGLYLDNCYIVNITRNVVYENDGYGIFLDIGSEDIHVFHNEIGRNQMGNAIDDGFDNYWDDGGEYGNFWSDCPDEGVYIIEGEANSRDRYPLALGYHSERVPLVSHPEDIYLDLTLNPDVTIEWDAWDTDPLIYQILFDGNLYINETWDGDDVSVELPFLENGTYNVTLILIDDKGYNVSDSVLVILDGDRSYIQGFELSGIEILYLGALGVEVSIIAIFAFAILRRRRGILDG
ncbi:MAG: right-handed parallel beta-helix repeat-containing protein [Candidatus Thorarchaeota archaeon]|nr:right-handed parallel beta-helix repeat-containing protein [Candidatus Thorarchaeota archaeon]